MAGGLHNYTVQESQNAALGQAGSIHAKEGNAIKAINGVFVAITFLEDTVFNASNTLGLIPESAESYPSSAGTSSDISANGLVVDLETFPLGVTIYGRWTDFQLLSGRVIAYLG